MRTDGGLNLPVLFFWNSCANKTTYYSAYNCASDGGDDDWAGAIATSAAKRGTQCPDPNATD